MRYVNLLMILPNLFNQVINLSKIEGANQVTIQTIYWLCWLLGTVLTYMSTRPGRLMLVKWGNIILSCRNILRLYDFEKSSNEGISLAQQIYCICILQGFKVNFQQTPINLKLGYAIMLFWAIGQAKIQGNLRLESVSTWITSIIYIGLNCGMLHVYFKVQLSVFDELLKAAGKTHALKDELNSILENLEESIIIMSNSRAEFVNQRFLYNFSEHILNKIPEGSTYSQNKKEKPSRFTLLKRYLKNKFSR